jgi:hypothetical protein
MSVNYTDQPTGNHGGATLRGARPVQRIVNNVTSPEDAQEQADALEQAVYENIEAYEADKLQKEQEAANLFGQRAEIALKLADSKPGDIITLEDGTIVRR